MMKTILLGLSLATATAGPAPMAQTPPAAPAVADPAPYGLDTPVGILVVEPAAKAALDTGLPSLTTNPAFDAFKSLSLKTLRPMVGDALPVIAQ